MTRETKIGLLVGLAFIIVIGILLSDHINSSVDPVRADAADIYKSVEISTNAPESRPQGQTAVVTAPPVVPRNPVPTQSQPPAQSSGSSIIMVGPGGDPSTIPMRTTRQPDPAAQTPENSPVVTNPPPVTPPQPIDTASVPRKLQEYARAHGLELVKADSPADPQQTSGPSGNDGVSVSTGPTITPAPARPVASMRQVKAEEGDTVSRLAGRYMGANTKANRDAIIRANPSMTPDGHRVIAGHTYEIPAADGATPAAAPPTQSEPPVRIAPQTAERAPAPAQSGSWYTVKENDTLWKIAADQLGSGARWTEIRDLNKDVLKSGEQVRANMRLKMPAKTVADAN